ncbi:MAG: tRNA threonylcarbamoyladenosine dehydratase [Lachnospiraceae bacterium]|nr:tRNA threonylcarbamoyladenosine dehydratase [Lachnospiraceae bacterium]
MENQFSRTEMLLGSEAIAKLSKARVAVFGLGGVGGYVCEALVRSGVKCFDIIDADVLSVTNLNRQIIATVECVGQKKTEAMEKRMLSINPQADIRVHDCFFLPENSSEFDFKEYDYVVDAVDTVTAKLEIIRCAKEAEVPVISSMGTGNKLNPQGFKATDISKTKVCPLAKVMRRELKKRGIEHVKCVYSEEEPITPGVANEEIPEGRRAIPGSIAFVPASAGLLIAAEVIKDLIS